MSRQVLHLSDLQLPLVNRFYKQSRYSAKAGRGDEAWVLKSPDIVAAVKLVPSGLSVAEVRPLAEYLGRPHTAEHLVFLRSMCVAPDLRGQGLGSLLLKGIVPAIEQKLCYCFPFSHLHDFYAQVGFRLIELDILPAAVRQAYQRYTAQGRDIIVMAR